MDPLAEKHHSFSPYAYVLNNPMAFFDPLGLDTIGIHKLDMKTYREGVDVVQLDEVSISPQGNYGTSMYSYMSPEMGVFAGYSAGSNYSGRYGAITGNITGFRGEYNNYTGTGVLPLAFEGGVKATAFQVSGGLRGGTRDNNVRVDAQGNVLLTEANATIGVLTGENAKRGAFIGGEAGAYVLQGEVNPSVSIAGYKIGGVLGGSLVSAHAGAGLGAYRDANTGTFIIRGTFNLGLGAGFKIGFEIEK